MSRRALVPLLLLLGVGVLAGAGWWWHRAQPAPNVGVAQVNRLAAAPAPSPGTGRRIPIQAATLPTGTPTVRPVQVRIDRLGVSASVVPVGVDSSGDVVIPTRVNTVGWYRFGPGLGSAGSTVLTGHVDNAQQGDGAFARLRELRPGDRIEVTGSDRHTVAFRVIAREEYPKATIRLDRYFSTTGPPRLSLVTCGGPFDSSSGHYRDNVVITATEG